MENKKWKYRYIAYLLSINLVVGGVLGSYYYFCRDEPELKRVGNNCLIIVALLTTAFCLAGFSIGLFS